MGYQELNSKIFDKWNKNNWEWGKPISHEEYLNALDGNFKLRLTPTKFIPNDWLKNIKGKKVLGLASGGAQQMPILAALGADITLLDYSDTQLKKDEEFALKEGYKINIVKADMSKPLPFSDNIFDMVIQPVSLSYVEDVEPIFKEVNRILKKNGYYLLGFDNGLNYVFDDSEKLEVKFPLPFNPLKNESLYNLSVLNEWGIQFSHSIEDILGGQLKVGFIIDDLYEDYNGYGKLDKYKIPTFIVTRYHKR